jgi:hypothetical protein
MSKVVTTVAGMIFLTWLFAVMAVRQYYTRHRPESPQRELSRTVPAQLNYGKTVYVTPWEHRLLYCTNEWLALPLAVVLVYAACRVNKSKPREAA